MPPVDLETLIRSGGGCVGGGGDGKVVCETLLDSSTKSSLLGTDKHESAAAATPPDFPAESFRLRKDEEFEWFDRNAYYERKQSTRGNASSFGHSNSIANPNSSSQRISVKSKAQIFGLPKLPDSGQLRRTFRRSVKRPSIRFFPKSQVWKTPPAADPALTEPSSPKVSCIGRVRSKRDRRRHCGKRGETKAAPAKEKKPNIWRSIRSMLRFGGRRREPSVASDRKSSDCSTGFRKENSVKIPEAAKPAAGAAPSSLVDLKRFSSGRRSASWGGLELQLEMDAGAATRREESKTEELWRRRAAAPPPEVIRCERDLDSAGPATV